MNEAFFTELCTWLTQAGLAGVPESEILSGLCERCVVSGIPLARTQVFIDTLHPVHEGHLFRWGFSPDDAPVVEYGRTNLELLAVSGSDPRDVESAKRWLRPIKRCRYWRPIMLSRSAPRRSP